MDHFSKKCGLTDSSEVVIKQMKHLKHLTILSYPNQRLLLLVWTCLPIQAGAQSDNTHAERETEGGIIVH
ncbi:hypothetical protein GN956_G24200 [Arapaima gigas]